MNVHAATGIAIVKLPSFKVPAVKVVSPFVLAGGGAIFFDPRGGSIHSEQTRGTFVYGGGVDVPLSKHFLRLCLPRAWYLRFRQSDVPPILDSSRRLLSRLDSHRAPQCCPHAGTARLGLRHLLEALFVINELH
jgi:hypothetical protein